MSSNLPPGVTVAMIPGNTPEELEYEALAAVISDFFGPEVNGGLTITSDQLERLIDFVYEAGTKAYSSGYRDGMVEERASKEPRDE